MGDNNFKAMEIRPWQQGQGRFMMGGEIGNILFSGLFSL